MGQRIMGVTRHFPTHSAVEQHLHNLGYRPYVDNIWKNQSIHIPMGHKWLAEIVSDSRGFYCKFTTEK